MKTKLLICVLAMASYASASTLMVFMTMDDSFNAYISTVDSVLGTLIPGGTGAFWPTTFNFSTLLTPNVTNYLHIQATNGGAPGGFLGDFTLDDNLFMFANGTQTLSTDTSHWGFESAGVGGPYLTPTDEGANGVDPWGLRPNISAGAHWIWDPTNNCANCTVFFSTALTPTSTPEPGTTALLVGGIALIWRRATRKRS